MRRLEALGLPSAEHCIIVSIDQQKLWFFGPGRRLGWRVSTARAGAGQIEGSHGTPLGMHRVREKIGDGSRRGAVFKARVDTGEVWMERPDRPDNLITTRILRLEGLEAGLNLGQDAQGRVVDTFRRFVYIHGTNQHAMLGRPNSHGCVLLSDDDVLELYDAAPVGTPVLILP
ncbi:MAG: L,D-transpeptidase family protein [Opitutales bacterium]